MPSSSMVPFTTRWVLSSQLLETCHALPSSTSWTLTWLSVQGWTTTPTLTMSDLHHMLLDCNPYVDMYKQAHQILREKPPGEQLSVVVYITVDPSTDLCRYNAPTASEVAAIVPGGSDDVHLHCDIIVHLHGGALTRINHLHHSYSPLHYVLLF